MLRTIAVLIAGELYVLPVPAKPIEADVAGLTEMKSLLSRHGDAASGVCGALCVDFGPSGDFKIADDGGNDVCLAVAQNVAKNFKSTGTDTTPPPDPCPETESHTQHG